MQPLRNRTKQRSVEAITGVIEVEVISSVRGLTVRVVRGRGLLGVDKSGTSDPYVTAQLGFDSKGRYVAKSAVVPKTVDPEWNAYLRIPGPVDTGDILHIVVWDHDTGLLQSDTQIGRVNLPVGPAANAGLCTLPLLHPRDPTAFLYPRVAAAKNLQKMTAASQLDEFVGDVLPEPQSRRPRSAPASEPAYRGDQNDVCSDDGYDELV